ncbi:MAG: GTP-binding protein [Lachnospiraceae bacterium]
MAGTVKIGVGGPVGSGKTALIEALCRKLSKEFEIGVITNDIYTKEDAQILHRANILPPERIIVDAIEELQKRCPQLDIIFVESGGDNLAATFSPELVDSLIFVIDVGEGDKIPRKGGPGITQSDLLVINKIDIAPYVHSDLGVMERDTMRMRPAKPYVFTNLFEDIGVAAIVTWIKQDVLFLDLK